jgi:predicted Zn finger-like uncharacterized protein
MIIECTSCGAKYKYDESKLGGASSKKVKCPKCKGVIDVVSRTASAPQDLGDRFDKTFSAVSAAIIPAGDPSDTAASEDSPGTSKVSRSMLNSMKMPEYRKYSLAVISGSNAGEIFQINKPKIAIGRGDADVTIHDLEASRKHAEIDIIGDRVVLHDLNSTNGTFVDEQKINTAALENHSEFRIGSTVFMLIITDVE